MQHYGSKQFDASVLLIAMVGFSATDRLSHKGNSDRNDHYYSKQDNCNLGTANL